MSGGSDDSILGNMGQGSRAIIFDARGFSVVKGHTGEESERGIGVVRCGSGSLFWA